MPLDKFADHFAATFPDLLGGRILIALSGGADSVALLHLLRGLDKLTLEAAHVHHGVRGGEADDDAEFCAGVCGDLEVPFHLLRLDPSMPLPDGREGSWRRGRYDTLHELASRLDAAAIATGHHRDDVAEGVLVQLLRGGGPRALSGIAARTEEGVIRPLLPWSRSAIRAWLQDQGLRWREDSSNRSLEHLRNRVRHELLPLLESASPSLRDHLVELAGALAATEDHLARQLVDTSEWIDPWEPEGGVEVGLVRDLAAPLRVRWLHGQAARVGIDRVTRVQLEHFEHMLTSGSPAAVALGQRWHLRSTGGRLWLEPPHGDEDYAFDLAPGDPVDLPIPGWQVRIGTEASAEARWSRTVSKTARICVRSPRHDDRLELADETVSAARIMARHLPRHLRRTWPVFCEDDRICWIPGVWERPEGLHPGGHVVEVMRRERPASGL